VALVTIGARAYPETLLDWSKEWPDAIVRFPLRATPPPHMRLVSGHSNQDSIIRSVNIPEWPPLERMQRLFSGARPSGLSIDFAVAIAGTGNVSAALSLTKAFAVGIADAGSVAANFIRPLRALFAAIAGSGAVSADQSGGTLGGGGLILTPETSDQTLTIVDDAGDALDLTSEDPPDSLTLTPA
jgi:hypothetical protein